MESVMKKPMYAKSGKNVVLPKPRPKNLKKKKTSEQIVREIRTTSYNYNTAT